MMTDETAERTTEANQKEHPVCGAALPIGVANDSAKARLPTDLRLFFGVSTGPPA
jgi:hypothetical protein